MRFCNPAGFVCPNYFSIKNSGGIMPRIVHFEFAADNPERAANFYRDVFGWQSNNWGGADGILAGQDRIGWSGH
jgi:predicted enzyme related to lactoylglutathione lyase